MISMGMGKQHAQNRTVNGKAWRRGRWSIVRRIQRASGVQKNALSGWSHNFNAVAADGIRSPVNAQFDFIHTYAFIIVVCMK